MAITFQVLGKAEADNALLVKIDSGQSIHHLLFDCGEACLAGLGHAEVQAIDHLFFSHLHMDHVAGFDSFFRANFNRHPQINEIWGPPQTAEIMHHRFRGFVWNLHAEMTGSWRVTDISPHAKQSWRMELADAFAHAEPQPPQQTTDVILETSTFTVSAITLDHHTPSIGYLVREKPRQNVDVAACAALGLTPGPWMAEFKKAPPEQEFIEIDGKTHSVSHLRANISKQTPGDSIAYLTDFLLDAASLEKLVPFLRDCRVLVCESQYRKEDAELAAKHHHLTSTQAASLAKTADVQELVLFHLSTRYQREEWQAMLADARTLFANTRFPVHWRL